jgi:hypothetical protein
VIFEVVFGLILALINGLLSLLPTFTPPVWGDRSAGNGGVSVYDSVYNVVSKVGYVSRWVNIDLIRLFAEWIMPLFSVFLIVYALIKAYDWMPLKSR